MRIAKAVVTLAVAGLSLIDPAGALESDQFYAWGRELPDATDVLNAKVTLEIDRTLETINARNDWDRMMCHDVVKRIVPRFRQFIFQDIELWIANSRLIPRIPSDAEEELEFRTRYLYRNTGPLDLGTKVPPSPTIELNGVRLGSDKVSHFFSEGWWYYKWYRKYRKAGASREEAERRAIRRGIWWERTILGLIASGVFSAGDLEANYRGMLFFVGLCEDGSPRLAKTPVGWEQVGSIDFREHVTPEWDESYQPPVFGKRRWKRVRPILLEYCPMLDDPDVARRRQAYARRDGVTPTELEIRKLVEAGKLRDSSLFGVEAVCQSATISADASAEFRPRAAP